MHAQASCYLCNKMIDKNPQFLSTAVAANMLGLSTTLVQSLVDKNELEGWKTRGGHRRISLQSIHDYQANVRMPGRPSTRMRVLPKVMVAVESRETLDRLHQQEDAWRFPVSLQFVDSVTEALLTLASERPAWQVTAVDRVLEAVALAERNRQRLQLDNVTVLSSHWFSAIESRRFHLIISNPPYIAEADPHLVAGDVRFEPESALVAGKDGLDDLRLIVAQAPQHLEAGGWLMLEHGYDQAEAVRELLTAQGFIEVHSRVDLGGHQRISLGCLPC